MNRIAAIALFALATVLTSSSATAQRNLIEVNVPFNFNINNTFLPAGTYTFGFDSMDPDLLIIRDPTTLVKAKDFGQRGPIGPGRPRTLILHRYGSQYFLSEIRFGSTSNGIFLPAAKSERQARKKSERQAGKLNRNEDMASVAVY
jgi:hypothetical protein